MLVPNVYFQVFCSAVDPSQEFKASSRRATIKAIALSWLLYYLLYVTISFSLFILRSSRSLQPVSSWHLLRVAPDVDRPLHMVLSKHSSFTSIPQTFSLHLLFMFRALLAYLSICIPFDHLHQVILSFLSFKLISCIFSFSPLSS